MSNVISPNRPSDHVIDRNGLAYSRKLTNEEIGAVAPAVFAEGAHDSCSGRYAYVSTQDLLDTMEKNGFLPVKVTQAKSRHEDQKGFAKHILRFRQHDMLDAAEAREVLIVNAHNGSSSFRLMSGIYRLVCANGLVVGRTDTTFAVRHTGHDAINKVIEAAHGIAATFQRTTLMIEQMKATQLDEDAKLDFARTAMTLRFDEPEHSGIRPEQLLETRRAEDQGSDLWRVYNTVQENVIAGGLHGHRKDALGRERAVSTRLITGIDQSVNINRALWMLAEQTISLAS